MYNYRENVLEDVKQAIEENWDEYNLEEMSKDEAYEFLNERLWVDDSVTGNASGSYTFNSYKAEEFLVGNWDLLAEAGAEFGCEIIDLQKGAEYWDVTIRCYLLAESIWEALDYLEEAGILTFED